MGSSAMMDSPYGTAWRAGGAPVRPVHDLPLVGRGEQVALGTAALADEKTNCLVVQGGVGTGKSRMATELLLVARSMGCPTVRATATEASSRTPLAALAHLLPPGVPAHDPVARFHAVAARLRASRDEGRHEPEARAVLLVDDLHLLDETSTTLLRQLLDADLIFLIACVRVGCGAPLNSLALQADSTRTRQLHLEHFTPPEITAYLEAALGSPVSAGATSVFSRLSRGNVLVLRELVDGALRTDRLRRIGSIWQLESAPPVTPVIAALVQRRLDALDSLSMEAVEILACCEPLDLFALENAVPGVDSGALESGAVMRVEREGRRYVCRLAHPLYAPVVRERIPSGRRRAIYRAQAKWLRDVGARRAEDLVRMATFDLTANGTADSETLTTAAALAHAAQDHQKVADLLLSLPPELRDFRSEVMRGEAEYRLAEYEEAERTLLRAQERAGDTEQFLAATALRAANALFGRCSVGSALDIVGRARERADTPDARRSLLLHEAAFRFFSPDVPIGAVADLLDEAGCGTDTSARHWYHLQRALSLACTGRAEESRTSLDKAVREHRRFVGEAGAARGIHDSLHTAWAYMITILNGDFAAARTLSGDAYHEALRAGRGRVQAQYAVQLGYGELVAGNLTAARTWYLEGAASVHAARQPMVCEQLWAGLAAVHGQTGDVALAADAVRRYERAVEEAPERDFELSGPTSSVARAWLAEAEGDRSRGLGALDEGIAAMRRKGNRVNESWLLMEKARLGAAPAAHARLEELARHASNPLVTVRARVTAAMALQDADGMLRAAHDCSDAQLHLLAAETAMHASRAFTREGDRKRAGQAKQLSHLCVREAGGAMTPSLTRRVNGSALTPREREVAALAARGMASKEIAEHLVVSVRTVENFLQRIYSKVGISSRRDLAAALARLFPEG